MSASSSNTITTEPRSRRGWGVRVRRAAKAYVPVVVWLGAVGVSVVVYAHSRTAGPVTGYAEHRVEVVSSLDSRRVTAVRVGLHDRVSLGQVLVLLDDTLERTQLESVRTELRRLTAEVESARATVAAEHARDLSDASGVERGYLAERNAAQVALLEQRTSLETERIRLANADRELALIAPEAAAATPIEKLHLESAVAEFRTTVEQMELLVAERQADFERADTAWRAYVDQRTASGFASWSYDPVLTPLKLAIEVQEKELESVSYQIERLTLRAPIAGQVTSLYASAGSNVSGGAPVLTLVSGSSDRLIAYVPESMAGRIAPGVSAEIESIAPDLEGRARRFQGVVFSVADEIAEVPLRNRTMPNVPQWGRAVVIGLAGGVTGTGAVPGEAFRVKFVN